MCVCVCSVGRTERSALQALRMLLFTHKSELTQEFLQHDPKHTGVTQNIPLFKTGLVCGGSVPTSVFKGLISLRNWALAMETVLHLGLPWRVLRSQLVSSSQDGMLNYDDWFNQLSIIQPNAKVMQTQIYMQHVNKLILETSQMCGLYSHTPSIT